MPGEPSQTPTTETRRLAAIMFTDIVGFSRQMGADEARMLRLLDVHNQLIQHAVAEHHGHVIKTIGDAFLVDFPSVVHAVQCAQQIQAQLRTYNADKEKAEQIHVRIGIHLGDIVQKDGDVFGDGVNIASRLQSFAEPDTICISQVVYHEVSKKLALGTVVSLGKPALKNITERVAVYALLPEAPKGVRQQLQVQRLKLSRRVRPAHRVAMGLGLLAGVIAVTWYLAHSPLRPQSSALSPPAPLPLPDKPSIVVLPFTNMSNDSSQDYFSDGITEDITTDLSRLSSLFVISRNTAFFYKGKAVKLSDLSKELGVRYVLEGSVRRADGQIRVTAQLIDATNDHHLWAERYARPLQDIFAVQDEIVQKIVTTLKLQLTLMEQGYSVRKSTDNLEAYDTLLRAAEYFWRYTKEDTTQARQLLEKAITLDPQYALAYRALGLTYLREWMSGWSTDPQTLERALTFARQALALDDSQAHALLGQIYAQQRQYDQALAESERALAFDPNNADVHAIQMQILNFAGRPEKARQAGEQALRLNPHAPAWYLVDLGVAYYLTGQYAEAGATFQKAISRNPNHWAAYRLLADNFVQQWTAQQNPDAQTLAQALAAAQQASALDVVDPINHSILGIVYLWKKQYDQALAKSERAIASNPPRAWPYATLAETLSRVGRSDEALQMVEQALRRKPAIADYHLNSVGVAYYFAGKPEEAIAPLKQYLTRYPNFLGAHLTLAAVYSELGKDTEARAEAAEVLRLNPKFSLEVHKERVPIKDPAILEQHIAALRNAGLK